MTITENKEALRKTLSKQRDKIPEIYKQKYDQWICTQLYQIIQDQQFKTIHTYLPMGSEINLYWLIEQLLTAKIKVITPKTLGKRKLQHLILNSLDELEKGKFGTRFPANSTEYSGPYDLIIVPGLAFDKQLYRLGYGGGYYDAFLSQHPYAQKIGIAYPFQIIDQVPQESHDQRLDKLLVNTNEIK